MKEEPCFSRLFLYLHRTHFRGILEPAYILQSYTLAARDHHGLHVRVIDAIMRYVEVHCLFSNGNRWRDANVVNPLSQVFFRIKDPLPIPILRLTDN